jgi:hypothetical protein
MTMVVLVFPPSTAFFFLLNLFLNLFSFTDHEEGAMLHHALCFNYLTYSIRISIGVP